MKSKFTALDQPPAGGCGFAGSGDCVAGACVGAAGTAPCSAGACGIVVAGAAAGIGAVGTTALPVAGAAGSAGTSAITPDGAGPAWPVALRVACQAMKRLIAKNAIASHFVALERKLAEPRAPNTVAEAPPPKPEPAWAPAPRCIRISATIAMAIST